MYFTSLNHHPFSYINVMPILKNPYTLILNREQISMGRNREKDISDKGNSMSRDMKHKIPCSRELQSLPEEQV